MLSFRMKEEHATLLIVWLVTTPPPCFIYILSSSCISLSNKKIAGKQKYLWKKNEYVNMGTQGIHLHVTEYTLHRLA